ncbi:MAG: PspC domain-containing protein [Culturomica sp.]|jgi:phage shock protein PspC (stress-responsive transcriptional regulator)|nr:PspC domain-containing protein [Culturomica sp.]
MKKVLNVGIGGRSFIVDEDAYQRLDLYLANFRRKVQMGVQTKEVMDDLETRIAELFQEQLGVRQEVVNLELVQKVISQLGMPDGSPEEDAPYANPAGENNTGVRKLYRDPDHRVLGGVCSGLAAYCRIDTLLVRVLFVVFCIIGGLAFWVYIIFWIVAPLAVTPAQKCEMRGIPPTAENMRKYSHYNAV